MDTPLYSPRSNGLAERAVQTLKKSLNFYNKQLGCSLPTYIDKVLFSHRNSSTAKGATPAKLLMGRSLRTPIIGFYDIGERVIYQPTINHQPKELSYNNRKGRNTAWLHDNNNRAILASDSQIGPLPSNQEVKQEPLDVSTCQEQGVRAPIDANPVATSSDQGSARPQRSKRAVQPYQAGFN